MIPMMLFNLKVQLLSTGVVTSPNYPCYYPNNLNTTETISVREGMVVVLEFTAFDIEYSDKLTIRDGDGTILIAEKSGKDLPSQIVSVTNVVHLDFYSDRSSTRAGWSATWTAKEIFCKLSGKHVLLIGDKRICDGKRDFLNGCDEDNCDTFHIETECPGSDCSNFESRHFNLTAIERNGPKKRCV